MGLTESAACHIYAHFFMSSYEKLLNSTTIYSVLLFENIFQNIDSVFCYFQNQY